jgi:hypothetical protein
MPESKSKCYFRGLLRFAAASLALFTAQANASLFSVGPDANQVPRSFDAVGASGATSQFLLGDGSLGFNGGLTYRAANASFYAVANDSSGNSSLVSFTPAGSGSYSTVGSLGSGFLGGLAYNSADGNFYAVSSDFLGNATLNRISADGSTVTALGVIGMGNYGGLAYNPDDGKLYAISGDAFGVQSKLNAIDIATATVASTTDLGDGSLSFNGGLAYDDDANLFYAISNDFMGSSALDSFTVGGSATPTVVAALGQGYLNAGLAWVSDNPGGGGSVPEPGSTLLIAAALLSLAWVRRNSRCVR